MTASDQPVSAESSVGEGSASHNSAQASYFSGLVSGKSDLADNQDKFSVIERRLPPPATHPALLECGGGAGLYTGRFLERGHDVTCVDQSAEALAVNRASVSEVERNRLDTVCADFVTFADSAERRFDIVAFIKVLHHFESVGAIEAALDAAIRLLRPGGQVVIFEPNGRNPLWKLLYQRQQVDETTTKWDYEQNLQLITKPNLDAYLRSRGLSADYDFHYVIPSQFINAVPLLSGTFSRVNAALEQTALSQWSANLSLTISATT